jgi:hypothetical protein
LSTNGKTCANKRSEETKHYPTTIYHFSQTKEVSQFDKANPIVLQNEIRNSVKKSEKAD